MKPWITEEEFLDAVELFRHDLIGVARRNCMSPADVEDAVQNGVMDCLARLHEYAPEQASLKTWVTKRVIWASRDTSYVHQRDLEPEQEEGNWCAQAKPKEDKAYDPRYMTDEPGYDTKIETYVAVHQALDKLKPEDKEIATAYFLEECTVEECAARLGIAGITVKRRIASIKKQIQALLS